jgi:hypothetical protein
MVLTSRCHVQESTRMVKYFTQPERRVNNSIDKLDQQAAAGAGPAAA